MSLYLAGQIYKLVCFETDKIYIGSTRVSLKERKRKHKVKYKMFIEGKLKKNDYTRSFDILENNNWDIFHIEWFPCWYNEELREREQFHIDNNDCVNCHRAHTTKEQEKLRGIEYSKKWKSENSDKVKIHDKNKYEKHKEKILKNRKIFYEENKDKINRKVNCHKCGNEFMKRYLTTHLKKCEKKQNK